MRRAVHFQLKESRAAMATALLVAACGGGGSDDSAFITVNKDFATVQAEASLSGTASLPVGSERAGGTPTMPTVTCQLGPYTLTWSNAANGSQGGGVALWDCPADQAQWSAFHVPLAVGANRITVTLRDSTRSAQAAVTVTRN